MTHHRPTAPPTGDWEPFAMTGVGAVVRRGQTTRPPSHVTYVPAGTSETGAWLRPAQVWVEDDKLYAAEWVGVAKDGGIGFDSFLLPTPEPSPSLLDSFLAIGGRDDVLRLAQDWGPLGICNCAWGGQPGLWTESLHQPHLSFADDTSAEKVCKHGRASSSYAGSSAETVQTWFELRNRLLAFVSLFDGFDVSGATQAEDAAGLLGLAWGHDTQFRRSQAAVAMNELGALGDVRPWFELTDDGLRMDLRPRRGLRGWLVMRALRSAGSIGESHFLCKECGALTPYGRRRVYCSDCGDKVARRDASRRSRAKKKREP